MPTRPNTDLHHGNGTSARPRTRARASQFSVGEYVFASGTNPTAARSAAKSAAADVSALRGDLPDCFRRRRGNIDRALVRRRRPLPAVKVTRRPRIVIIVRV